MNLKNHALWCNGSTADFGSVSPGSNPGGAAKERKEEMGVEVKQYLKHVVEENLNEQIEDCEETLKYIREKILMMVVAHPKMLEPKEENYDTISYIRSEITSLLEEYEENVTKLSILETAKNFPEDVEWDSE